MFVGATTILDNAEHVSKGFIPHNFFDHLDSDAYTSPMFDIDEVFEIYQGLSAEQVLTSEVQDLTSNLYSLHSSDTFSLGYSILELLVVLHMTALTCQIQIQVTS